MAVTVIVLNPYISNIYQFAVGKALFFLEQCVYFSSYLFVGMNLDRAVAIAKPFYASNQAKETILIKILASFMASLLPATPYLFDTSIQDRKVKTPEKTCWPPTENVINELI